MVMDQRVDLVLLRNDSVACKNVLHISYYIGIYQSNLYNLVRFIIESPFINMHTVLYVFF